MAIPNFGLGTGFNNFWQAAMADDPENLNEQDSAVSPESQLESSSTNDSSSPDAAAPAQNAEIDSASQGPASQGPVNDSASGVSSEADAAGGEPAVEEELNEFGFRPDEMVTDEDELEDDEDLEDASPIEEFVDEKSVPVAADDVEKQWYILKVQVNRENSICDTLKRRVKVAGMEPYFGEILVPTEDVREYTKAGKQRIVKRKLYPGYIVVNMKITDDSWFMVRETGGIGDFTGAVGAPVPLTTEEVSRIIAAAHPQQEEDGEEATIKTAIPFKLDDRVRVKEGYFQNYEGEVSNVDERNGRITVLINIFGRPNPVELDHWHVEKV